VHRRLGSTAYGVNRAAFIVGALASIGVPQVVSAASPLTIVCVTCTNGDPDLSEQAEDQFSGALINEGVSVADPSAISARYHEEGRAAIVSFWGGAAMAWQSVSWVDRVYHARRLFAAQLAVTDSSLPYGEFTIHQIKTRLSYKCYDVVTHEMIAAGSVIGKSRGEDVSDVTDDALAEAIKVLAPAAGRRLNHTS
jgi:hypothetical protein